jgi:ABC-2 type transport system permease protein
MSVAHASSRRATPLRGALGSEWIKFWSVRSTWWSLFGTAVLLTAGTAILGMDFAGDVEAGETTDGVTMGFGEPLRDAAPLAQFGVLGYAMLTVTAEFATGTMRGTLAADPRRGRVLAAKTAVVVAVTLPLALVLALLGVALGHLVLGSHGTGDAGEAAGDVAAVVAYLTLTAVLTVGAGAVLRSSVGTLSCVLVVMLALPLLVTVSGSEYLPGHAALALLAGDDDPLGPGASALVLAVWAAATLGAGRLALARRDV